MSVIIQGPVSGLSDADQAYIDLAQATVPDASKLVNSDNLGTAAYAATGDFDAAGAAATAQAAAEATAATLDNARVPFAGSEMDKKDLMFNLSVLPDVSAANFTDVNLRSFLFIQQKSHFAAGRLNHYGVYLNNAAQYSAAFGWNNNAVDPTTTGTTDGSSAKGQFLGGYSNNSFSPYTTLMGFCNSAVRIGFAMGQYNYIGITPNYLSAHNWTSPTDSMSVGLAGDYTVSYPPGKFVMLFLTSSNLSNTPSVKVDRVVSSSYSGGTTTIYLSGKSDYQATVGVGWTDANGIVQRSWIVDAQTTPGNPTGGAIGRFNYITANGYSLGHGNRVLAEGIAIGKQAIVRTKGEVAVSSGAYTAFSGTRWAQESKYILKVGTVATTQYTLTSDGAAASATNQINLYENTSYALTAIISASLNDGTAGGGAMIDAVVHRDGSNNITVVGQNVRYSAFMAGLGSPTIVIGTDATNRAVNVKVTPAASNVTYWTATVTATIAGREMPAI